jgi:hypothetical protein
MSDRRTDTPGGSRDLAVVVRFVDGFTRQPLSLQLSVSIPGFPGVDPKLLTSLVSGKWFAWWSDTDATYRFSLPNLTTVNGSPQLPRGTFDLLVTTADGVNVYANPPAVLPGSPYAAATPLQVTIPPVAPHPPPVLSSDYLVELPLWPTPAFRVPDGETAVSGWVVSAGATNVVGLKLRLSPSGTGPAGQPWVGTDGAGQFLYRLPGLRRAAGASAQATIAVEVVDPSNAPLSVAPKTISITIGTLTRLERLMVP